MKDNKLFSYMILKDGDDYQVDKDSILKKSGDTFLKVLCCPLFIEA